MTELFELKYTPSLEIQLKKYNSKPIPIKIKQARLLSDSEVVIIRETYERGGYTMRGIAELYNVTETLIGKIIRGEIYAGAGGAINRVNTKRNRNGGYHKGKHVSLEKKAAVKQAYVKGKATQKEIAEQFGVSRSLVSKIVNAELIKAEESIDATLDLNDIREFVNKFENIKRIKVELKDGYTIEKSGEEVISND